MRHYAVPIQIDTGPVCIKIRIARLLHICAEVALYVIVCRKFAGIVPSRHHVAHPPVSGIANFGRLAPEEDRTARILAGMSKVTIRGATLGDVPGMSQMIVQSWREAYRGVMPDAVLDDPNPRAQAFYLARGFVFDGRQQFYEPWGVHERHMVRNA